jgi:hypothetical protein
MFIRGVLLLISSQPWRRGKLGLHFFPALVVLASTGNLEYADLVSRTAALSPSKSGFLLF